MAICIYLSDDEKEEYREVFDHEVNQTLQQLRELDAGFYLREKEVEVKSGIFHKRKTIIEYTLYYDYGGWDMQVINFCPNSSNASSINIYISRSEVMAYMGGFINGYEFCKKQLAGASK